MLQQSFAQYTQVPDPNFEQALIDLGIDSEGILDGQFLTADAENVIYLGVQNSNINDLKGIEAFVNLEWLDAFENNISQMDLSLITSPTFYTINISYNNLTTIDLSQTPNILNIGLSNNNITSFDASNLIQAFILTLSDNPLVEITLNNTHLQILRLQNTLITQLNLSTVISLQKVFLPDSQIQNLDFTHNQTLEEVYAYNTPLTNINLPNNPNLETLNVESTQLSILDITSCNGLIELQCGSIGLTNLDLTNNINLETVGASFNQLTSLNVSQIENLKNLYISNNIVTESIDLNNNVYLENINFLGNLLTEIDFSNNPALEIVDVSNNNLLELVNMKNSTNESTLLFFDGHNCPQLSCVVVDDPLADNSNFIIDANAVFVGSVEECNLSINSNELQNLISVYPNPVQNELNIYTQNDVFIKAIKIYNLMGSVLFQSRKPVNQIDVSNFASGVLFVKIETNKGLIVKKVGKE